MRKAAEVGSVLKHVSASFKALVAGSASRVYAAARIWLSLALLAVPTLLLGFCDDVVLFGVLRVLQGVCMATAFTLTMTYLSEQCDVTAASGAMAAYITGNVGSNLFGRLMAGSLAEEIGLAGSFFAFAALNLLGAIFAYIFIGATSGPRARTGEKPLRAWRAHLSDPKLRSSFLIGFIILFLFVGIFTYVNFELVGPRFQLDAALLGAVYFVFLPSIFTTPIAGGLARRLGADRSFWIGSAVALIGIAATLSGALWLVLAGLAAIGVGLFFAQAAVSGFVGRTAKHAHAAANGLYLSSYYFGGLVGAFVLGAFYQNYGWFSLAAASGATLILSMILARKLRTSST